ncbi:MAG: hypothetical protein VYD57_14045 [Pseudomonadota bacterium]|nr:hypothetical protein [Pseudomonadota bacterium]
MKGFTARRSSALANGGEKIVQHQIPVCAASDTASTANPAGGACTGPAPSGERGRHQIDVRKLAAEACSQDACEFLGFGQPQFDDSVEPAWSKDSRIDPANVVGGAENEDARSIRNSIKLFQQAIYNLSAVVLMCMVEGRAIAERIELVDEEN